VLYGWNEKRERFNTPWENKIEIKEYRKVEEATIRVSILNTSQEVAVEDVCRAIGGIFRFYDDCRYTLGLKSGQNSLRVIIQDDYIRKRDGEIETDKVYGDPLRGKVSEYFPGFPNAQVIISVSGCKETIDKYKDKFHERYPEYKDHEWTIEGMVFYVIAHEIAHLFSPEYLHGTVKEEILAILYGSTFAFKKDYIYVPQGEFLKTYWKDLGINLSSKDVPIKREAELRRCKNKIRSWLIKSRGW
jgi:hypothetical protein